MKLIVDIDDNLYTRLFDNGDEYVADMRRACVAIRKGKSLPNNATNGDMIKAIFPNLEWLRGSKDVDYYYLDSDTPYAPKLCTFKSWWNAPYKTESEE